MGEDYYYLHDHMKSPVALVDIDGEILERYEYDAYGKPTLWEGDYDNLLEGPSWYNNPYYFTGRRLDVIESGTWMIQYHRNRFYDYGTGRWLNQDPIGYQDGPNLYAYVHSNPINRSDPQGLQSWSPADGYEDQNGNWVTGGGEPTPCADCAEQQQDPDSNPQGEYAVDLFGNCIPGTAVIDELELNFIPYNPDGTYEYKMSFLEWLAKLVGQEKVGKLIGQLWSWVIGQEGGFEVGFDLEFRCCVMYDDTLFWTLVTVQIPDFSNDSVELKGVVSNPMGACPVHS